MEEKKTYPPFQSPLHFAMTRFHYQRSCQSKYTYISKQVADAVVARIKEQYPADKTLESYECRYCGEFHVGHPARHRRHGKPQEPIDDEDTDQRRRNIGDK